MKESLDDFKILDLPCPHLLDDFISGCILVKLEKRDKQHMLPGNSTPSTLLVIDFEEHFRELGCVAGVTGEVVYAIR